MRGRLRARCGSLHRSDCAGAGGPVLLHVPRPTRRKRRIGLLLDFRKAGPPAPALKRHRALRKRHSDGGLVSGTAAGVGAVVRGMVFEPNRRGRRTGRDKRTGLARRVWFGASLVTFLRQESHSPAGARPGAVQRTLRSISKSSGCSRRIYPYLPLFVEYGRINAVYLPQHNTIVFLRCCNNRRSNKQQACKNIFHTVDFWLTN